MFQVRDKFRIKFGKIDQAIQLFNRLPSEAPDLTEGDFQYEILTDLSGEMYTLVTALQLEAMPLTTGANPAVWARPGLEEWFASFQQFVENGNREFFVVQQANDGWSSPGVLVVRSCFRALEWRVEETVDLVKRYGALLVDAGVGDRPRILTDASGQMFNVVIEIETPDLKTWDDHRRTMFREPQFQTWFLRLTGCVSHGWHQFYTVAG